MALIWLSPHIWNTEFDTGETMIDKGYISSAFVPPGCTQAVSYGCLSRGRMSSKTVKMIEVGQMRNHRVDLTDLTRALTGSA